MPESNKPSKDKMPAQNSLLSQLNSKPSNTLASSPTQVLSRTPTPSSEESDKISSKDMGFGWKSADVEEIEMDMTPMMDCSFLLLIFFVINATFAINEIKNIQVPKAIHTQPAKQDMQTLTVSLTKERKIYLNKGTEAIEIKDLKNYLAQLINSTSQQDVILIADHSLDYGFIVAVLDEINGAGTKNVKLKLEKKNT